MDDCQKKSCWIATCGPIGFWTSFPGTLASILGVFLSFIFSKSLLLYPFLGVLSALGFLSVKNYLKESTSIDPSEVVIDEVVGMMISLLFVPVSIFYYILGFILFRFFDIAKPFPIQRFEKWPGAWGVMMDDVVAGLFANVIIQLIIWIR